MARHRAKISTADVPATHSHPKYFDDERHHEALEELAVRALSAGDFASAFKLADRRCRIPPLPQAHHYTLRAEALYRLDDRKAALRDIARALELRPEDVAANRRMLAWGKKGDRSKASAVLVRKETNLRLLPPALKQLGISKRSAFANIRYTDRCIFGWARWSGRAPITIDIQSDGKAVSTRIAGVPKHPLGSRAGRAASFVVPRPLSKAPQIISIAAGTTSIHRDTLPANDIGPSTITRRRSGAPHSKPPKPRRPKTGTNVITVVVPVYGDYQATKACLDGLKAELQSQPHVNAIIVNDASPDARITSYLRTCARWSRVQVLLNERNLGFVRSVNQALGAVSDGDVILLNADTVVPPGFTTRLRAAAYSQPDIGTVVPLSNNGEFTSFPVPNTPIAASPPREIFALDAAAAAANAGCIVPIPNGTGFCLYITRSCLDAVGSLLDIFERGYLEDADFCLRAREAGFLNVCAPSVYVGHEGSRSFGAEKRVLVVRNLARLETRFPDYRNECAIFVKADPLRDSRAALERQVPFLRPKSTILVAEAGPVSAVASARARQLERQGGNPIVLEHRPRAFRSTMHFAAPSENIPQSLAFEIAQADGLGGLAGYLGALAPASIELIGPPSLPDDVLDLLGGLGIPLDVLIAGGNWGELESLSTRWQALVPSVRHLYAPDDRAMAFAKRYLSHSRIEPLDLRFEKVSSPLAAPRSDARALGLLALGSSAADYKLIREIALGVQKPARSVPTTIVGTTLNDLELMKIPNVMVTGSAAEAEMEQIVRHRGIKAMVIAVRQPLFGHPLVHRFEQSDIPLARFAWPAAPKSRGLQIDPTASDREAAQIVARWFARI